MLKMKYLWTLALVALCVSLASGMAFSQDSWSINLWDDDDDPDTDDVAQMEFPAGIAWELSEDATLTALNDGTTTWTVADVYALICQEATFWGTDPVLVAADVAPDETADFTMTLTAPPITGTFPVSLTMSKGGAPFGPGLAEAEIMVTRFPDTTGGSAGEWAASQIEGCAGRVPFIVLGFGDGLYRPVQNVSRGTMAVYIRRAMGIAELVPAEATFDDVALDYWASKDIEALAADDATAGGPVIAGYGDGTYQPDWLVTRGQMAKFIALGAELAVEAPEDIVDDVFPDVPADYWAANFIKACKDASIVLGYTDGFYRPGNNVSRDQMAVYAYKGFIAPTTCAVVTGGPGLTDTNPESSMPDVGWESNTSNPLFAYVLFESAKMGPELLAGANGTWDITFEYRDAAAPTHVMALATVNVDDLTATGDYFLVSAAVPDTLATGDYILAVMVEDKTGVQLQLPRTVALDVTVPPPPPGPEGPFVPDALDSAAGVWDTVTPRFADPPPDGDGHQQFDYKQNITGGSLVNLMDSDDRYLTISIDPKSDSDDAAECCDGNLGATLVWSGVVVPTAATDLTVTVEYHVDGAGFECCSSNPCDSWGGDNPTGVIEYGWGVGLIDFSDVAGGSSWNLSAFGDEADLYSQFDYTDPAQTDGEFARNPIVDETIVWTVPIADAAKYISSGVAGVPDGTLAIHWCGGASSYRLIDKATIYFEGVAP